MGVIYPRVFRPLTLAVAAVWLINGLYCKVLNGVPRHREIVEAILGPEYALELTIAIGLAEIIMAAWIVSGYRSELAAVLQIVTVGAMNILEATLVPELLLWGRWNLLFALGFIVVVYYNQFRWRL